ncbi:NAD(P)-dependent oxidoreductase [Tranquillimonas alkanivorans]|uniref:3-hydroxyisobutyrate dehydrogenase n=1 Tax=Tranquillimonas alkanivorans TaxID=441119 RepID=A0A1I5UKS4_9RHOB|nr:NAD(P)-dependent oxidoreductase [Tranquillimonas alkanivorans]SFP95842.1 3-hydroxyisobutyrate dehydrogenase [Tranquillimonas alkanivorans]
MAFGTSTRAGLVGLGIMGAPIARRLRQKGVPLTVWNLEPERFAEVEASGAVWADSPAEVWRASEVVFTCVLGDDAIESVCLGDLGFARAEGASLLVDLSTTSPEATEKVGAGLAEATGAAWIDAPMSGGPQAGEEGNLTLMIGGEEEACQRVMPLLELLSPNITRMGDLGAGQKTKIVNQAIVGANYVLMAEILAVMRAAGMDPSLLPGALKGGMADSTILQRIYTQMAAEDFDPPRSYARQLSKDLKSVAKFVEGLGLDLPVMQTGVHQYRDWAEAGNGMEDGASVARLYEKG